MSEYVTFIPNAGGCVVSKNIYENGQKSFLDTNSGEEVQF